MPLGNPNAEVVAYPSVVRVQQLLEHHGRNRRGDGERQQHERGGRLCWRGSGPRAGVPGRSRRIISKITATATKPKVNQECGAGPRRR